MSVTDERPTEEMTPAELYVPQHWDEDANLVGDEQAKLVLRDLWDTAMAPEAKAIEVRRALFATMSRQWRGRPKELCNLRLGDMNDDLTRCTIERFPQHHTMNSRIIESVYVTDEIRILWRRWMSFRGELMVDLTGGTVYHVFVIVQGNHSMGKKYKMGRPLRPNGAERDLKNYFLRMNANMAGMPGWAPLPRRIEPWRRGSGIA